MIKKDLKLVKPIKEIDEPMYLEGSNEPNESNPITSTFHVKNDWASYIKPYIGQPFSPKELDALGNVNNDKKKPTSIKRTEIWYQSTDDFGVNNTTVIKKLKDGGQYSYTAFQKHDKNDGKEDNNEPQSNDNNNSPFGSPSSTNNDNDSQQKEKDDIIVSKSTLFNSDIDAASTLIKFINKLDL